MNGVLDQDPALTILGRGQPGAYEMNFVMIHALVQDRSIDLLTSSPARYHCATDAPLCHVNI